MIPINTSITWWYPIITRIAWWYHSPQAVYDGTHDLTRCMTKSLITSLVYNDTWYYLSSHSLLDDIWSTHTLLDDSIHLKLCMMIHNDCMMIPINANIAWQKPFITSIAWSYHSIQALQDDPFITNLAWWYLSSQTLHNEPVLSSDAIWKQLKRRTSGPVKDNWGLSRMFLGFTTWNCRALS